MAYLGLLLKLLMGVEKRKDSKECFPLHGLLLLHLSLGYFVCICMFSVYLIMRGRVIKLFVLANELHIFWEHRNPAFQSVLMQGLKMNITWLQTNLSPRCVHEL